MSSKTLFGYLKEIIKKEGPLSLYKGLNTGLIATVLGFAIYFFWYRFWSILVKKIRGREELSMIDTAIVTSIAGTINTVLTNPIWLVNTRQCV